MYSRCVPLCYQSQGWGNVQQRTPEWNPGGKTNIFTKTGVLKTCLHTRTYVQYACVYCTLFSIVYSHLVCVWSTCVYLCTYVCMYIIVSTYIRITYIHVFKSSYIHMHCMYTYVCAYTVHTYVGIRMYVRTCMHTNICTCTHVQMYCMCGMTRVFVNQHYVIIN